MIDYQEPRLKIILFDCCDIVRTSSDAFIQDGAWDFGSQEPTQFGE